VEQRAIAVLCHDLSIAEIAARLHLPLGVTRVLVGDMADERLVMVYRSVQAGDRPDRALPGAGPVRAAHHLRVPAPLGRGSANLGSGQWRAPYQSGAPGRVGAQRTSATSSRLRSAASSAIKHA
jgi:hypothetical protein